MRRRQQLRLEYIKKDDNNNNLINDDDANSRMTDNNNNLTDNKDNINIFDDEIYGLPTNYCDTYKINGLQEIKLKHMVEKQMIVYLIILKNIV